MRSRDQAFRSLAAQVMDRVRGRAGGALDEVLLACDLAPVGDARTDELARVYHPAPGTPATVVVYRMPVLQRSGSQDELVDTLADALAEACAELCAKSPEELRPQL